ncbi:MAG TPA: DUF1634 domain-containing protein [Candidatus Bathyarchaeia archaeon]|nr:DUF1634 domain-containing protein [Candidatus Bathyarchaeia archaeon]
MDVNRLIFYTLRTGVLISAMLAVIGLTSWALGGFPDVGAISGSGIYSSILSGLTGNSAGLVYLAIAVLIATPVMRVALSVFYFAYEKDRKYVLITITVLAMLIFALVSGSVI